MSQDSDSLPFVCPLGVASAFFDISDEDFVEQYVRPGLIRSTRLHQFPMKRILELLDETPERCYSRREDRWLDAMHAGFDEAFGRRGMGERSR